jgi:mannose-1-phosphate guanylyltransferase
MFAWMPDALLDAARESPLAPLVSTLEAGEPERGFEAVAAESVDHAILERAEDVSVVPAGFDWDDLGTWDAVWRTAEPDATGTAHVGEALALDTENCLLATDGHVSAVGVSDLVVASFGDRTLVVPRGETERVREVVDRLEAAGRF